MTGKLPLKGPIGLKQIGAVFEDPPPVKILEIPKASLWQIKPQLRNKPVKFSSFYGQENTVFISISGSQRNVNIDTLADQQKKGHVANIKVTVKSGSRIGSNSTSLPSLKTGFFSNNSVSAVIHLHVERNAYVYGKGGDGGYGGNESNSRNGGRGGNGGDAIVMDGRGTLRITNDGGIGGGGGGGGGGSGFKGCAKANKGGCIKQIFYSGQGGFAGTGNPSGRIGAGIKRGDGGIGGKGGALGKAGSQGAVSGKGGKGGGSVGKPGGGGAPGYAVRKVAGKVIYLKVGNVQGVRQ